MYIWRDRKGMKLCARSFVLVIDMFYIGETGEGMKLYARSFLLVLIVCICAL